MGGEISIIITISLIIFSSPLISKLLKLPTIPVEIMMGTFAAYLAFIVDHPTFHLVAELGFL